MTTKEARKTVFNFISSKAVLSQNKDLAEAWLKLAIQSMRFENAVEVHVTSTGNIADKENNHMKNTKLYAIPKEQDNE